MIHHIKRKIPYWFFNSSTSACSSDRTNVVPLHACLCLAPPTRCLFPTLAVSLRGLELRQLYEVSLRMSAVDNYRYKYSNNCWVRAGDSDVSQDGDRATVQHPCSPTSGQSWMKRPVSFKFVKITHYPNSRNGNVRDRRELS